MPSRAAIAAPAADLERYDHALSGAEVAYRRSRLDYPRDELVTERKGAGEGRAAVDDRVIEVAGRHHQGLDDRRVRTAEHGIRDFVPANRAGLDERQLPHDGLPS